MEHPGVGELALRACEETQRKEGLRLSLLGSQREEGASQPSPQESLSWGLGELRSGPSPGTHRLLAGRRQALPLRSVYWGLPQPCKSP